MLKEKFGKNPLDEVTPIIDSNGLEVIKKEVKKIFIHDEIYEYIARIAAASRSMAEIELGISPRGSVAVSKAAQASAYINGRNYVIPEDVNKVIMPCVRHRIILNARVKSTGMNMEEIINRMLKEAVNR